MRMINVAWPTVEYPPGWMHYDWHSWLWEINDAVTVKHGAGVFCAWIQAFIVPGPAGWGDECP